MKQIKNITGKEFDELFDSGSDEIDNYIDWNSGQNFHDLMKQLKNEQKEELNISLSHNVVVKLNDKVNKIGISIDDYISNMLEKNLDMPHAS